MPFTAYGFDESVQSVPRDSTAAVHVPEGGYLLEILACYPSKEDQDTFHRWNLKIVDGAAGKDQTLTYFAAMRPPQGTNKGTLWRTGDMVYSAFADEDLAKAQALQKYLAGSKADNKPGIQVTSYEAHVQLATLFSSKLAGRLVYGLVIDKNDDGKLTSIVDAVKPPSVFKAPRANGHTAVDMAPAPDVLPANQAPVNENFLASVEGIFANTPTI